MMATTTKEQVQVTPVVPAAHPLSPPKPSNLSSVKGLAVAQLIIGILTGIFGITAVAIDYDMMMMSRGYGIWTGGWIALTGMLGVCSVQNHNHTMNIVYMAFSILSTCTSGLTGFYLIGSVIYFAHAPKCSSMSVNSWDERHLECNYRDVGLGINVPSLILLIVEVIVSIVAAVYCYQNRNRQGTQGMVIHQQPCMPVVATSGGGPTIINTGYPTNVQYGRQMASQCEGQMAYHYGELMAPQYVGQMASQYGGNTQPKYITHAQPTYSAQESGAKPLATVSTHPMQQTNVTYSQDV